MKLIDKSAIDELIDKASLSERRRAHLLLHTSHDDVVQRILIGFKRGSYVEPHYHKKINQWEMFAVLQGVLEIKTYDEEGLVREIKRVSSDGILPQLVEFTPGEIHSVECVSSYALMLEVKEGPFDPSNAKSFPDRV